MKSIAIVFLLASTAIAQNQVVVQFSQTEGLLVKSATPVTVERIAIQQIGAPVVVPGPVTPVDPSKTLEQVVHEAREAVPQYADKDKHCQALAFTIKFLSQAIVGDGPADAARAVVAKAVGSVAGNDADKWQGFLAAVNAKTAGQTAAQYSASLKVVADAMCDHMAAAQDSEMSEYGVENYGLDKEFLKMLMEILLPLLLKLLAGL